MKLKPVSPKKVVSVLIELGYSPVRQKGSHLILRNDKGKLSVVPMHQKDIGVSLLREIIRELGITREEFLALCRKK
ncbi:MAG: type II toxin-antitoxin system HicA family toxin [Candidatus Micrarchaeia archaeon]